jgi:hypothetical protein
MNVTAAAAASEAGEAGVAYHAPPALVASLDLTPALAALLAAPGRRVPTVLLSAETSCDAAHEPAAFDTRLTRGAGLHFPCLNSGQFAGPAGDLAAFLGSLPWDSDMNDQATVYRMLGVARREAVRVLGAVDHEADVFLSMFNVDAERELQLEPRSRRWRHTAAAGAGPVFWHWNGHRKRSAVAVGLLSGERGVDTTPLVRQALQLGAAAGVALLLLGLAAGFAAGREAARAPSGVPQIGLVTLTAAAED